MSGQLPPAARLMGFGFFVALSIIGGLLGGVWLDGVVGLSPLFTLLGLLLGFLAAGGGVLRLAHEVNKDVSN